MIGLIIIFALCILPVLNLVIGVEFINYMKTHQLMMSRRQLALTLAFGSLAVGMLSGVGYSTFTLGLILFTAIPIVRMFIFFKNATDCRFAFENRLSFGIALTMFAPLCILTFAVAISGNL